MPAERTLRLMMIVAGVWLAGAALTRGQSPDCPPWEQRQPAHAPRPQYRHAMAYDSARGVTVLAGVGTWEWDGADWTMVSEGDWRYSQMTYDEARHVCVLFRGGSTWEWDGVEWTLRQNGGPPWVSESAMAYDSTRGVTVLFGGIGCPGYWCGDTWEWDGITWELRSSTGPSPRNWHAMAYDSRRHVTVLYGGSPNSSSQTWEWDGSDWSLRTSFVGPRSQYAHTMSYDSARGVTLLFPSRVGGVPDSQTWAWDGTTWKLFSETGPPGRLYSAMAYDSMRRATVLFGGAYGGFTYFNDTWELPSCPVDSDGDGVLDPDDECDFSDLRLTVVIDGCDSGVANHLLDDGCTMADRIGACAEGARNHGAFRRCVRRLTREWVREDLITLREWRAIRRCAAHAGDDDDNEYDNGDDGDTRPTKNDSISPAETLSRP